MKISLQNVHYQYFTNRLLALTDNASDTKINISQANYYTGGNEVF
jgi:hypothetical protein